MPGNADRPAGPGRTTTEIEDAVKEQEGLDELEDDASAAPGDDEMRARHAERDANVPEDQG